MSYSVLVSNLFQDFQLKNPFKESFEILVFEFFFIRNKNYYHLVVFTRKLLQRWQRTLKTENLMRFWQVAQHMKPFTRLAHAGLQVTQMIARSRHAPLHFAETLAGLGRALAQIACSDSLVEDLAGFGHSTLQGSCRGWAMAIDGSGRGGGWPWARSCCRTVDGRVLALALWWYGLSLVASHVLPCHQPRVFQTFAYRWSSPICLFSVQ